MIAISSLPMELILHSKDSKQQTNLKKELSQVVSVYLNLFTAS